MAKSRPKLILLEAPGLDVGAIEHALGGAYDIEVRAAEGSNGAASPVPAGVDALLAAQLLGAIGEGVALASLGGDELWSNRWFGDRSGEVRAAVMGVCRDAGAEIAHATGRTDARRYRVEPATGGVSDVEVSAFAGGEGEPTRLVAVVRDVTAEYEHQRKIDAIARAGADLVRLDAEEIRRANMVERLRMLEKKVIRLANDLLHFHNFSIRLLDKKSGRLEVVISRGLPQDIEDLELYASKEGNGICGWVAATGEPYLCTDPDSDPLFLPGVDNAKATLTVPLRIHDQVIGVMDIESTEAGAFTASDLQFAEIFARHVAIALHILDLLVVERSATNEVACGRVEGELSEPLDDILAEAETLLASHEARDPESVAHLQRIKADVESIRRRVRNVAAGPQTLLGVERALARREVDPALVTRRVLIADDEAKIRRVLGDVLKHRGATVVVCENGRLAIDELERAERGEIEAFDLIISDIKMPDRNGYEVFSAARRVNPDIPVILMTGFGYDPHHSIVRASQEGLSAVLFKPFQIERMIEEVRSALSREPAAEDEVPDAVEHPK
ncbi:MAG: response regulator [Phycisphaerales bacterium JB037]